MKQPDFALGSTGCEDDGPSLAQHERRPSEIVEAFKVRILVLHEDSSSNDVGDPNGVAAAGGGHLRSLLARVEWIRLKDSCIWLLFLYVCGGTRPACTK